MFVTDDMFSDLLWLLTAPHKFPFVNFGISSPGHYRLVQRSTGYGKDNKFGSYYVANQ